MTHTEKYSFKAGETQLTLEGNNIEKAMWLADTLIGNTANGYWKCSVHDVTDYTWTIIPSKQEF
tara:strand:- start:278 stop:469 length:192 start_codon:yes stop_codon:yes gene_type:complete